MPAAAGNVIFVCISSAKLTDGRPMMTPLALNGNGPLNGVWKFMMSSCWSMIALLVAFCAAVIPEAWKW